MVLLNSVHTALGISVVNRDRVPRPTRYTAYRVPRGRGSPTAEPLGGIFRQYPISTGSACHNIFINAPHMCGLGLSSFHGLGFPYIR